MSDVMPDGSIRYNGTEASFREQLRAIVMHYPLWPGDTLSHDAASECGRRGWAVRNSDGNWIPTAAGVLALESANG